MMNFENHPVRVEHINTRTEYHGDDEVLALDVKITTDLPNTSLDRLSPTLRRSLYDADDTPDIINPDHTPRLRNPELGTLHWAGSFTASVTFRDPGHDDDLSFLEVKIDKVTFLPRDGGTIACTFRVKVYPEDEQVSARVLALLHLPDVRGTLEVFEEETEEVE
ncbi:hypothetical protein PQR34_45345 [Paraburkholderia sediminicola]|uniref:hypothetical protein n=1 Tax=Paraburkholderia sediminicola TaxID=458836 RepID=UPI0038BC6B5C